MFTYIAAIIVAVLSVITDQLTKLYILSNFRLNESVDFIPGFIDITYIENGGGAWGMLNGYTWVLLSVTIIIMLICITMLIKMGFENKIMFWAICLVLGGGVGNMIDRIFRGGNVVDFLHFTFWPDFPVFNIADITIVIGGALLVLYFIISIIEDNKKAKTAAEDSAVSKNEENK